MKIYQIVIFLLSVIASLGTRDADMNGRHFKSAVCEQPGGLAFIRNTKGEVVGYTGPHQKIFDWISRRLNFTYTLMPVFQFVHGALPNGSYIGMHELIRTNVDFSSCALLLTYSAYEVLDYTSTVVEIPDVVMIPPPVEESRLLAPFKPFPYSAWLAIIGSAVLLIIAAYTTYSIHNRNRSNARSVTLLDVATVIISVTLGQDEFSSRFTRSVSQCIVLGVFCLTSIVIVNSYTSSFISFAATPKLIPLAKDIDDIVYRTNLQFVGTRALNIRLFTESSSPAMRKAGEQILSKPERTSPDLSSAGEKVASGCCAILYPKTVLGIWLYNDWKKTGKCRCSFTEKVELYDFYAFGGQKGDPRVKQISKEILIGRQFGLIDFWYKQVQGNIERCLKPQSAKVRPLKFYDLSGVFLLFAAGVWLSFTLFIIEVARGKLRLVRRNQRRTLRL